ncbi:hypothetical protein NKI94_30105 [Mesorhizobium australicum]|uniref:hypothetical protein n=1 Tax=Mesorhizobium australicum TaxID=536018 RepID=UPI00333D9035
MSIKNVRYQITRFLQSEKAEVLCIRGNWGTGKTWTWNDVLRATKNIPLTRYSYVSLFGLNSLDDIKQEIFHQGKAIDALDKGFSTDDLKASYQTAWTKIKPVATGVAKFFGEGYSSLSISVMSYLIRDTIICIDDLERKGELLRSADVLGLISQLKDDRNCKVVLLLNDEQLEDRGEFDTFLEKVVDVSLRFAPSPTESAKTAFIDQQASALVKEELSARAITLGIDNVRVIRKILRTINELEPLLKTYKAGVMKSVISSLTLFGWSYLQRDSSPPLDYIRQLGEYSSVVEAPTPELAALKKEWGPILQRYGYNLTDEFDDVLIDGVVNGYFDPDVVALYANQLHEREKAGEANAELDKAWEVFHGSFANNADEMISIVTDCFKRNANYFSFSTTAQLIDLLRRIDETDASNEVFGDYAKANKDSPAAFDTERLLRFGYELPADIVAQIEAILKKATPDLTNDEKFLTLKEAGFNSEIGLALAKAPVDEYVRVLTNHANGELKLIRAGITDYVDVANPPRSAQDIMNKAADALTIISKQSPLNNARARSWRLIQWQGKHAPAPKPEVPAPEPIPVVAKAPEKAKKPAKAKVVD